MRAHMGVCKLQLLAALAGRQLLCTQLPAPPPFVVQPPTAQLRTLQEEAGARGTHVTLASCTCATGGYTMQQSERQWEHASADLRQCSPGLRKRILYDTKNQAAS